MGPRLEGIELMAGGFRDREHAGQRTSGHVSSTGESEQQDLGDVQRLPSDAPKPVLLVQEVRSQRGEDRNGPEGGTAYAPWTGEGYPDAPGSFQENKLGGQHYDHQLSSRIVILNRRLRMSASSYEGKCTYILNLRTLSDFAQS